MSRPTHSCDESNWAAFVAAHRVGDVVEGRVVSRVPFGAFVRVDGVDGLAPQSLWPTLPDAESQVSAQIVAVDEDSRRFALGPA